MKYRVEATIVVYVDFEYEDDGSGKPIDEQISEAVPDQDGYPSFCEVADCEFVYNSNPSNPSNPGNPKPSASICPLAAT